jgi:hypothetical protein
VTPIQDKVKRCLAAIEAAAKALHAVDADSSEAEAVATLLGARRSELAEIEQQIARTKKAAAQADAEHAHWRSINAKEQQKANATIDALQSKLQALEGQAKEAQAKFDNIIGGIRSLRSRIEV